MEWNKDDIINGEEFYIKVKTNDLKDKEYDLKIFIYGDDENKPFSEAYDDNEDKWVSSSRYINKILSGPGDKEEEIKMRIKDSESDFSGNAKISCVKQPGRC